MFQRIDEFHDWWNQQQQAHPFHVTPAPLDQLTGWSADQDTGVIRHRSGRFFSVEGLEVSTDHGFVEEWSQPIIDQPESGILGILVKRVRGVPYFLMQAKAEPGNVNVIQLSPTVQATKSNYSRVHQGKSVPYLEHFLAPRRGRILSDVLQSEQGAWFLHKRNRNMIIEIDEDVDALDGFCWLSREQLSELFAVDNLVNMDSRTVLAGYPLPGTSAGTHNDTASLLSWFTEAKSRYRLDRRRIPLNAVKKWIWSPDGIRHEDDKYFSVIGVDVVAGNREVAGWSQPLLAPKHRGLVALLVRRVDGQLQVLMRALTQAGTLDVVEIGPTVQCAPGNHADTEPQPAFLDHVLTAPKERLLFDTVHSEEGGRFYHAENRYVVVDTGDQLPDDVGHDFTWMTLPQLAELARYSNHVNVEARNVLACLIFQPSER
ncbi:NDP-hexose 2,3-dehydratase [Lentzea tibetensis]|uniref:NDP-hexose 2,3-dehydratase n=1 Tax=Lentzea tibetensis TaxID=2591470 RepID=A0A563ES58_9PSEU|nr:NDP-hexose 2,3-dehydratase family protein [Lentzea tibetensis]TWP50537.1 NDP-hexose 2,3-dehydratase [Lentzea tibetensis]